MEELPTGWRDRGRCWSRPDLTDVFYSDDRGDKKRACEFCNGCEVTRECLAYALLIREPMGVWGGHTAEERKQMNALGSAIPGYKDGLQHQLAVNEVDPQLAAKQPDWSIF